MRTYDDIRRDIEGRRTYLIELQCRPDGVTNSSINSYSTPATTMSMFHQRCATAYTNTTFVCVTLIVVDELGGVLANQVIKTQYVPETDE